MPHKIEVSGYNDEFCGKCTQKDTIWSRCRAYNGQWIEAVEFPRRFRRCPACIADEKAQEVSPCPPEH